MPNRTVSSWSLLLACVSLAACGDPTPNPSTSRVPLDVRVYDPVVGGIASAVGETLTEVGPMVPPDESADRWRPDSEQLASFLDADVLLVGGREPWTDTAALPNNRTLALDERLSPRLIEIDTTVTHAHGPDGEHSHREVAPNAWLDPELATAMSEAIRDMFIRIAPAHQDAFRSNEAGWRRLLMEAAAGVEQAVNAAPTRPVLFATDDYRYLQRRYGINGRHLDWVDVESAGAERLSELNATLATHPAAWLVWPSPPPADVAETLRENGVESVVFPLPGHGDSTTNLVEIMRTGASALARVYGLD